MALRLDSNLVRVLSTCTSHRTVPAKTYFTTLLSSGSVVITRRAAIPALINVPTIVTPTGERPCIPGIACCSDERAANATANQIVRDLSAPLSLLFIYSFQQDVLEK